MLKVSGVTLPVTKSGRLVTFHSPHYIWAGANWNISESMSGYDVDKQSGLYYIAPQVNDLAMQLTRDQRADHSISSIYGLETFLVRS